GFLLAGVITCDKGWDFQRNAIKARCQSDFEELTRCPLPPDPCTTFYNDIIIRIWPDCSDVSDAIIEYGKKFCQTGRGAGLQIAIDGCSTAVSLLVSGPRDLCYNIVNSTSAAETAF
ncbi:hypothetical protein Mgra_00003877, partial [Meloidogyne graminicola]